MTLAMKSLCESHNDIRTLMTALELPVSDWEDKWIDVYLDISSKLLDICNIFSSKLSRLNQGNLPLKCALHNLDSASSKQYLRACSLLDYWVFTAAFSGSSKKLSDLNVADIHSWAPDFRRLQNLVIEEIGVRFSGDTVETDWLVKTIEELRAGAEKLSQGIDLLAKGVYGFFQAVITSRDTLLSSVSTASALGNDTDQLSSLRFKEAVENNPFNVLASWNSSTHFFKWHGVTCSLNHQRVSALNLQGYALRGLITPEIGNLTFLRYVNLQNNSFYGEIPHEIVSLVPRNQVWLQEFV
ncbi:Protein BPS1, chloroplastic [Glycine soja]|uniref:Protein BPS1, chloroplastic n=1 Tax=Glycine soja TaxID=3848 RepID=A0A0B2PW15_GLYSO|nr:Protein BPS1, chloroplastic [Glycine soja]